MASTVSHMNYGEGEHSYARNSTLQTSDFNSLFKLLPDFYEKLKRERDLVSCFVSGVPGSFYTKLFPTKSLHFAHSSYSLHFLSQLPKGIENKKGNIYISETSPPIVFEAYLHQFQNDFSRFLRCRWEEIVSGGLMVLTLMGRSRADPTCKDDTLRWDLLSKSLLDMAAEGRVQEADIDSFNLSLYSPCREEVITIVEKEGSFILNKTESFEAFVVASEEKKKCGENMVSLIRGVFEPMLAIQFGESVMDDLFARYANYVDDYMSAEKTKHINIVISLTKLKEV